MLLKTNKWTCCRNMVIPLLLWTGSIPSCTLKSKRRHRWPPLSFSFVMQRSQNVSVVFSTGSQRQAPPTLSHRFDSDNFTGVSTACSGYGYHPDTVLTVPAQVGDAVEEDVWGCLELAAHLGGRGDRIAITCKSYLPSTSHTDFVLRMR